MKTSPITRRTLLAAGLGLVAGQQLVQGEAKAEENKPVQQDATHTLTIVYVGTYGEAPGKGGGIVSFEVTEAGKQFRQLQHIGAPAEAGYLVYAPALKALYSVDELKTDGRGPVGASASVHAFSVDQKSGGLTALNSQIAPGPFPTFLSVDDHRRHLVSANHGSFEHVEHIVQKADGTWSVEYLYDDSAVILYDLGEDGRLGPIRDLKVLKGHGMDPNTSLQAGGHGQASAHAHCAVIDPSGKFVLVCDKGTDEILVYRIAAKLELVTTYQMPPQTGPRHIAFAGSGTRFYATLEFASDIASFDFDAATGKLELLDRKPSVDTSYKGGNEPADLRVHPNGRFVYLNNRGEDTLVWFGVGADGKLTRKGQISLAKSLHPGVAARSFSFDPTGTFLVVADRPANSILSYAVDPQDGSLTPLGTASVASPAFVVFATLAQEP